MPKKKNIKNVGCWTLGFLEQSNFFYLSLDEEIFIFTPAQLADFITQSQTIFNTVVSRKSFEVIHDFLSSSGNMKNVRIPQPKPLKNSDKEMVVSAVEKMLQEYRERNNKNDRNSSS